MDKPSFLRSEALCLTTKNNLSRRGFETYYCKTKEEALQQALDLIPVEDLVSWGGSATIEEVGLLTVLRSGKYHVIDRDTAKNKDERQELMRKALLSDTFLMSSNAISADGQLVNIDGNGNRVAAMSYGPKNIVLIAGVNKIAPTLDAAIVRARTLAATMNIQRFPNLVTPCSKTGICADCNAADSICNYVLTTRRCNPPGKIKIILVGETLGY